MQYTSDSATNTAESDKARARARLLRILPPGSVITSILIYHHLSKNGYSIDEYHFCAVDPLTEQITVINRELNALGLGVNRTRGTIRTTDPLVRVFMLISERIHGDPDALKFNELNPTV